MSTTAATPGRAGIFFGEVGKLSAFLRRDFLTAWSYRVTFVSDFFGLILQTVTFYFVGLMVDDSVLPSYGGETASYLEFATVGIALSMFIALGLGRVARAVRSEQMMGTIESVFMTPTSPTTVQLGSVVYDLIYIPIRTAIFLTTAAFLFSLDFDLSRLGAAALILVAFIPFVWGLGITTAAGALTIRGSAAGMAFGVSILTLVSGTYVPLELFPGWVESFAAYNPMAIAIEGMRETLLGDAGRSRVAADVLKLLPISFVSLLLGIYAFRTALRRERKAGTLGHY